MNALIFFGALVATLLLLLFLALRHSSAGGTGQPGRLEGNRSHVNFLPQVRRAISREDDEFLAQKGTPALQRRVRHDRRRVALKYLLALREDFEGLLRIAKIIAALSPEIGVGQELERLRLSARFLWRFRVVQVGLFVGYAPLPQVDDLGNLISGLNLRLEGAMKKLGERAALVAQMASSADRGRVGLA